MVIYIWLLLLLICFFLKDTHIRKFYNIWRKLDISPHNWYIHPLYIQWSQDSIFALFFYVSDGLKLTEIDQLSLFLDILIELWSFGEVDEVEYDAEHNSQEATCMVSASNIWCSPPHSWNSRDWTEVVSSTIIPVLPTNKISASFPLAPLLCRLKVLHPRVLWVDTTVNSLNWNLWLLTPSLWLFISLKAKKQWEWC